MLQQVANWHRARQGPDTVPPAPKAVPPEEPQAAGAPSYRIVEAVLASAEATFDEDHGGFGTERKFLHPELLELLLVGYRRFGHERFLKMATRTLRQMRGGKVYDRYMGGFFRYSTTRDWSAPHYEKMLHDNTRLALVYLHAFRLTGDECYRKAVAEIAGYLHSTLASPGAGFYGSQDADQEYYSLALRRALQETYLPGVIVEEKAPPAAATRARPRAHICAGKTCLPPLGDPAKAKEKLLELVRIAGR